MIRAIIFDCFGVLASDGWLPYKARHFGQNPAVMEQVTALNKAVDAGELSYDAFIAEVAKLAGLDEGTARGQIENNVPDTELFAFVRQLKQTYAIGLLSNAGDNWLDDIFTPEQVAMFDAVALSYEMGIIKPDARAYETVAARLGVKIQECVFVDDQPKYIEGARAVGMRAVLYRNFPLFKAELERLLADAE